MLAFRNFFLYTIEKRKNMKEIEKLIEIEALLENLMKNRHKGGILRIKILFFCSEYQNLPVGMIIEKLGIKKANFALMTTAREEEGCIEIKKSEIDRRCRLVTLTEKGRNELGAFLNTMRKALGNTTIEVDKAIDTLSIFLNKII